MAEKFTPFTPQDSVMLLIDHQQGTLNFCRNISRKTIVQNARALARIAKALDMPVVLTTSQEDHAQGPLIPDMQEILPEAYEARIKRSGMANAWHDENYRNAVLKAADGRKNIIMAGLTNDVCIVYPSISMVEEGFRVQVVQDAGGSPNAGRGCHPSPLGEPRCGHHLHQPAGGRTRHRLVHRGRRQAHPDHLRGSHLPLGRDVAPTAPGRPILLRVCGCMPTTVGGGPSVWTGRVLDRSDKPWNPAGASLLMPPARDAVVSPPDWSDDGSSRGYPPGDRPLHAKAARHCGGGPASSAAASRPSVSMPANIAPVTWAVTAVAMPRPQWAGRVPAGDFGGVLGGRRAGGFAGAATLGSADEAHRSAALLGAAQSFRALHRGGEGAAERLGERGVQGGVLVVGDRDLRARGVGGPRDRHRVRGADDDWVGCLPLSPRDPAYDRFVKATGAVLAELPTPAHTAFHAELWITPDDRIVFCEIAGRTGGGMISAMVRHAFGTDLDKEWLYAECGLPSTLANPVHRPVGCLNIPPSKGGLDHLPTDGEPDCVREVSFTGAVGQEFPGGVKSGLYLAGYVIDRDTEEEVAAYLHTVAAW